MRYLLFTLMLLFSPLVEAKCADKVYLASGVVTGRDAAAAKGAIVGASWIEHGEPAGPVFASTDALGRYTLYIRFRTDSGFSFFGDRCDAVLETLSVTAYQGDERSRPLIVQLAGDMQVPLLKLDSKVASPW
jgi:hypothetical protein